MAKRYWPCRKAPGWEREAGEDDDDLPTGKANFHPDDMVEKFRLLAEKSQSCDHKRFREVSTEEEEENRRLDLEEEDDDEELALAEKRRMWRVKALQKLQQEEEAFPEAEEEGEEVEEESDSELDDDDVVAMVIQVFMKHDEYRKMVEDEEVRKKTNVDTDEDKEWAARLKRLKPYRR